MAETICENTLKAIYVFLSLTVVFLPLVAVVPDWIKIVPFYRKASYIVNLICSRKLEEEEEFPSIDGTSKKKCMVSCIRKGQRGFNEMLNIIKNNHEIKLKEVKRICLSWGDIPIETPLGYSPNTVFFIADKEIKEDGGVAEIVIFNEFAALHPNDIREMLLDWTKSSVQKQLNIYTAVIAMIWTIIMILLVF